MVFGMKFIFICIYQLAQPIARGLGSWTFGFEFLLNHTLALCL